MCWQGGCGAGHNGTCASWIRPAHMRQSNICWVCRADRQASGRGGQAGTAAKGPWEGTVKVAQEGAHLNTVRATDLVAWKRLGASCMRLTGQQPCKAPWSKCNPPWCMPYGHISAVCNLPVCTGLHDFSASASPSSTGRLEACDLPPSLNLHACCTAARRICRPQSSWHCPAPAHSIMPGNPTWHATAQVG